ncbi:MAG TPA: FHA domain-containing protein [Thermoleophilaceae bacterium]
MLKLQAVEGNSTGSDIAVEEELVIGRTSSVEGRLGDDPEISRQHARVSRSGEGYVIEDLGSMNGTFVNGDRLQAPHQLVNGDYVEVGGTRLLVHLEQPAPPPPPDIGTPAQDDLGATRIAGVPSDIPAPPEPEPAAPPEPGPAQGGDTFVKPAEEQAPPFEPQAPAAGPQAPAPGPPQPPPFEPQAPPEPPQPPPFEPQAPFEPSAEPPAPDEPTFPPPPPPPPPPAADMPPPTGPPQETVTPPPVPVEPEPEPAEMPPPSGPPQDTVTPAPVPVEPEPEPAAEAPPVVSLEVRIDMEAGEATIELADGADRVTLTQQEGRWVLKPAE